MQTIVLLMPHFPFVLCEKGKLIESAGTQYGEEFATITVDRSRTGR
jgi:hypothetical protein